MTSIRIVAQRTLLQTLIFTMILAFTLVSTSWAQDQQTDKTPAADATETAAVADANKDAADTSEQQDEEEVADLKKIVVTGSRLQRATYSSISPLQIITAKNSRESGLIDVADILQGSNAAAGQQIDLTFTGFVLDNGPGASTISLRGLGAARTLVLLNGRRLAPSGVEGAPSAPDLNLVPASMVQSYEVLLDGASSVYGSDAVAGVANIIMRKDYDGFEFDTFYTTRDQGNGDAATLSAAWGKNFDRGSFSIGAEYDDNNPVTYDNSDFTKGCERNREIDQNGKIRSQEQFYTTVFHMPWDDCNLGLLAARVFVPAIRSGSIYFTPGFSNGAWPDFSESSQFGFGVDSDLNGVADLSFRDYDLNGKTQYAYLFPKTERLSVMAQGEYTFKGESNTTVFFEANFNSRDFFTQRGEGQLFPNVPANNPFNICNPNGVRGKDCGLGQDALYTNPGFVAQFGNNFEGLCASFGIPLAGCTPRTFGLLTGPIGAVRSLPIVSVSGDRNTTRTSLDQIRIVVGARGDLPVINWGAMNGWSYEASFSYTNSDGNSKRKGVRGDRLDYSLTTSRFDENGNIICGNNDGCVPIDMFAPSLYPVGTVVGDFATQAERDYLFDTRTFNTEYTQTIFSAYANGYLFNMQGGTVLAGIGFELRNDEIDSNPDDIARDGLFFGFFADGGASGEKWTREAFAEVELPVLAGLPGAHELTVNLSGRYTDDEIYGSDTTGTLKIGWRPIASVLLRATYGTSFRAPNLREVFLQAQTGFTNVNDPCVIPGIAIDPISGGFNPDLDPREPQVLENCRRQGVDPTKLDNGGFTVFSTEVAQGGSRDLEAETSDSYTYGFSFEQPWFDTFDLTIGATYYDIKIKQTIVEPSAQFLVNDCLFDPEFDSTFCDQIQRDSDGFLQLIDASFINRDQAKHTGADINVNFDKAFNIGSHAIDFGVDLVMNHPEEASTTFIDDNGNRNHNDEAGRWGFPDWKGQLGVRTNIDDFRFTWVINYIGDVHQNPAAVDPFDQAITGISDTCVGPPTDVLCRDVGFGNDYWLHSASLYWYHDQLTIGAGVRNVFDVSPPFVDGTEVLSVNNTPIGYGYDLNGRTFFLNVTWRQ